MEYKKAILQVDSKEYIYSIKGGTYYKKVIVYPDDTKVPYFIAYISYIEAWGFDVYSPKTIEILIRFYNKNRSMLGVNEFKTLENLDLFQQLLEIYFENYSVEEKEEFHKRCFDWYDGEGKLTNI